MLIPLLPEHQRLGRKSVPPRDRWPDAHRQCLLHSEERQVILMAEVIKENTAELRRFKRAERGRTGAKSIKRGQEIPIAVLVPTVTLRGRLDLPGIVRLTTTEINDFHPAATEHPWPLTAPRS